MKNIYILSTIVLIVVSQSSCSTEIEQPEEPEQPESALCACVARCCTSPFQPRRASPVFHMPSVQGPACCGCVYCPSYFIGQQALPAVFPRPVVEIEPPEYEGSNIGET